MKFKLALLSMLMSGSVLLATAQQGGGMQRRTPEEMSKRVVDTLTTVFKLDQAKQTEVQAVFTDFYKTMQTAMQSGTRPEQSEREKWMAERDEKLKKVLTAEQFKKYKDDIEPAMRMRRPGGGGTR
jgi:hypothetical protein